MFFFYKAKSKEREVVEGVLDATDRLSLARELRSHEEDFTAEITGPKSNGRN